MKKEIPFWSRKAEEVLKELESSPDGLTDEEAKKRLEKYGYNTIKEKEKLTTFELFINQFKSPLILLLIFAAGVSYYTEDKTDAIIILFIVFISGILGFWQEKGATDTVKKLLSLVKITASVIRNKIKKEIPVEEVVPGDVIVVSAGDVVPADCLLLESKDLFVNEAILTGEPFPVEKEPDVLPSETPLNKRKNILFMGTSVVGGYGKAVVVKTGKHTEFGKISQKLKLSKEETEFERGIRRFSYILAQIALIMTFIIFAVNIYFNRPFMDSLLFALALAVGITPALLPAIVSINLSYGARRMADKKVIVKRLVSIENFGSVNVFCSDKTGTLTEGKIEVYDYKNAKNKKDEEVLKYAYINAIYETGYKNPIDEAVKNFKKFDISNYKKLDELPFDFLRKKLTVLVKKGDKNLMITKGAFENILEICSKVKIDGEEKDIKSFKTQIEDLFRQYGKEGFRVVAVAYKDTDKTEITFDDEKDMVFFGFVLFHDPLKEDIKETINNMKNLGIQLKILTGDNRYVAAHIGKQLGIPENKMLTGEDLEYYHEQALIKKVNDVHIFAELEPMQKERVVRALSKAGNVVGYMGDGVNDLSALHSADVGISVNNAVDIAKEAADFVLLEKSLKVLLDGIKEGRKTFINTIKYIFMTTSANFGNIISMAGASFILPFLPMLPTQVLATNLLTDLPVMTIPSDKVDKEWIDKPKRWNLKFIKKFMVYFGLLSSFFDFLTFGALLLVFKMTPDEFRTGWFVVSVLTELVILWILRTKKPMFKSKPSTLLFISSLIMFVITLILPYTPIGKLIDLVPLPLTTMFALICIIILYGAANEFAKHLFYKKISL